jgi:hypothetical protein
MEELAQYGMPSDPAVAAIPLKKLVLYWRAWKAAELVGIAAPRK